jgi:hypothetical protein
MDLLSILLFLLFIGCILIVVAIALSDCDLTLLYADKYGHKLGKNVFFIFMKV